jgi:tetratricopeptide (TPR) repeat protein
LVKDTMSFIWAARKGLSEAELMDLLGSDGKPLPRAIWSPLYLVAEQSLVSRSGLIGFFHDYFREAVRNRYLITEKQQNEMHLHLADYFNKQTLNPRKIDELPWQFASARAWQSLYDLLSDLDFFESTWRVNEFEVKGYWVQIEANTGLQMIDAYSIVLKEPQKIPNSDQIWLLGMLFEDTGHSEQSLSIREYLVKYYKQKKEWSYLSGALGNQALIFYARGDLDGAMKLHKEEERICRELGSKDGLQRTLGNQALILFARGDLDGAMKLHKEEEWICRELGNKDGLQRTLGNQARILKAHGDLDEAMKLHKEKESICRELGNKDGLSMSLNSQALILQDRGDLDEAMKLHKESESICRELGNKDGLQRTLNNQALILFARGDLDGAMKLHKEQERICRELGSKNDLSISLGNQALILFARGDLDGALKLHKEEERIYRELGSKDGLQRTLGNQARILFARGDLDGALKLLKEQERICRELGIHYDLSRCLYNQALLACRRVRLLDAFLLGIQSYKIALRCQIKAQRKGTLRFLILLILFLIFLLLTVGFVIKAILMVI